MSSMYGKDHYEGSKLKIEWNRGYTCHDHIPLQYTLVTMWNVEDT